MTDKIPPKKASTTDLYIRLLKEMGDGKIGPEISHLLNSRYKLLYITTNEERRVVDCLKMAAMTENYELFQWDISRGLVNLDDNKKVQQANSEIHKIPEAAVRWMVDQARDDNKLMNEGKPRPCTGYAYLVFDMPHLLGGNGNATIERLLKEFAGIPSACCIIIVSHAFVCPPSLRSEVTVVDFPYPSKAELKRSLKLITKDIPVQFPEALRCAKDREEDLLNAVKGLTLTEAENAWAKSLVKHKNFHIPTILDEKRQMIRKNEVLEFREPRFSFNDIGGLNTLKKWLQVRKAGFSAEAQQFGIDTPKGVLLLGVPGTGKSLCCDALAAYYEMPLLRLDMGSIFGSLVGESEARMRSVLKICESIAPCVLWCDEIEKGVSGLQSSSRSDSGTTARVFGTLLTWMQEKTQPVFIVCTANNVTDLPPEFMRAGRFDEIFFVDLPNDEQRHEVISCLLNRKKRNPKDFDIAKIVKATLNYSPAEIEKAINNALFAAFFDKGRAVTTEDVINEVAKFQPLYHSRKEEINEMRTWALGEDGAGGRAVLANSSASFNTTAEESRFNERYEDEKTLDLELEI